MKKEEVIQRGFNTLISYSICTGGFYFSKLKYLESLAREAEKDTKNAFFINREIETVWAELNEAGLSELWEELDIKKCIYYYSHKSLAAFKLAEYLHGIERIRIFMSLHNIPYVSELEAVLMDKLFSDNEDSIEDSEFLSFYYKTKDLISLFYNKNFRKN